VIGMYNIVGSVHLFACQRASVAMSVPSGESSTNGSGGVEERNAQLGIRRSRTPVVPWAGGECACDVSARGPRSIPAWLRKPRWPRHRCSASSQRSMRAVARCGTGVVGLVTSVWTTYGRLIPSSPSSGDLVLLGRRCGWEQRPHRRSTSCGGEFRNASGFVVQHHLAALDDDALGLTAFSRTSMSDESAFSLHGTNRSA
jgi:hypothetical protein